MDLWSTTRKRAVYTGIHYGSPCRSHSLRSGQDSTSDPIREYSSRPRNACLSVDESVVVGFTGLDKALIRLTVIQWAAEQLRPRAASRATSQEKNSPIPELFTQSVFQVY